VAILWLATLLGTWVIWTVAALGIIRFTLFGIGRASRARAPRAGIITKGDPLAAVQKHGRARGPYLGLDDRREWRFAGVERAVLVLGPPRSGKTQAVIIPAVLAHAGAVVSASTKPDVLHATATARSRLGRVWEFDPTGEGQVLPDSQLRWSPVTSSQTWDGALLMARAMVSGAGVGAGTTEANHWARRAVALLAPLLHAAALGGYDIGL
jgi:hypothetical protein